ncbi:wall-associated receptor kinase-like 20 [Coffea eugenioides]|uniref:wall-associated receptor kinase-like 20 n=1 Tax=Coffea eugenioides TaxID=49369 RepID=UPI000F60C8A0|nr:wall-associated receptor kinase-like 20 [Coffea eugenioides]
MGCCDELKQPLMVYEDVPNRTPVDHLQGLNRWRVTWTTRLNVPHAIVEGLAYLHFSVVPANNHRDVKYSNHLLHDTLNAKISDFGLSRLTHTKLDHISMCAQRTLKYVNPEYKRKYRLTDTR